MKKNPIEKTLDVISEIFQWCCVVIMAFLIVAVGVQVFARYVLNHPTSWSEAMSQIAFIWLTIFGCTVVIRDRAALNVDLLQTHLHGRLFYILMLVCDLISIVVSSLWTYSSILQIKNTWKIFEGGLTIRRGVIYVGIAFAFAIMVLFEVSNAAKDIVGIIHPESRTPEKTEEEA